jgi:YD repeat-containing protein
MPKEPQGLRRHNNEANQPTEVLDHDGESTTYSYGANGALTDKTQGTDSTTYSYNGMDKLAETVSPSTTVNYAHDALGRKVQTR